MKISDELHEMFCGVINQFFSEEMEQNMEKQQAGYDMDIAKLKEQVKPYKHPKHLPPLPYKGEGSIYGVGFAYDEDKDGRILLGIEKNHDPGMVFAREHEGEVEVFTWGPDPSAGGWSVANDHWNVRYFVPFGGAWREMSSADMKRCVERSIFDEREYCFSKEGA